MAPHAVLTLKCGCFVVRARLHSVDLALQLQAGRSVTFGSYGLYLKFLNVKVPHLLEGGVYGYPCSS